MIETIFNICSVHPLLFCCAIFILFMLAGCNIPISIDVLVIGVAFYATHLPKESAFFYYLLCCVSALSASSLAFYLGTLILKKGKNIRFFSALLPQSAFNKNNRFARSLSAPLFFVGRFVPFGIRNILYISAGLTNYPYKRFLITDAIATFLWSGLLFASVFLCAESDALFIARLKKIQLFVFIPFLMTLISLIWYNIKKKKSLTD